MGFFDTLIQSAGPPLAAGFAGGIEDDRVRRANLADNVQAYRSLMPYKMGTYEQQKQIDQRYNKPQITFAPKGSPGYFDSTGFHPTPQAAEQTNPLMGILTGKTEVPQEPAIMPSKPGTFDYGAGEEAMAGAAPTTRSVSGEQALLRMFGMNPQEREVVPHLSAKGEVSASFQKRPVERDTASPVTDASQLPEASPGMQWVQGVDAKGRPSWRQVAKNEKPNPLEARNIPDNVIFGIARGVMPPIKLADGTTLDRIGAKAIEEGKIAYQTAAGAGRGAGFAASRPSDVLDIQTNTPVRQTLAETTAANKSSPGRFLPLTSTAAPFYPGDVASKQATYLANVGELKQLQAQRGKVMAFANTASSNLGLVEQLSEKVDRTGTPAINRWLVAGKRELAGDVDVSKLDAAMRTAINEYARVTSTATGGGVTSDQARKEVETMLNSAQTKEQVRGVIQLLRQEMGNRQAGYDQQIQQIGIGIRGDRKQINTPGQHRLSGTKTNKPDGQYPLKDGTTITVKGGVVQ